MFRDHSSEEHLRPNDDSHGRRAHHSHSQYRHPHSRKGAELSSDWATLYLGAKLAHWSGLCYLPYEALTRALQDEGLQLVAYGRTSYTCWYVADGCVDFDVLRARALPQRTQPATQQGPHPHTQRHQQHTQVASSDATPSLDTTPPLSTRSNASPAPIPPQSDSVSASAGESTASALAGGPTAAGLEHNLHQSEQWRTGNLGHGPTGPAGSHQLHHRHQQSRYGRDYANQRQDSNQHPKGHHDQGGSQLPGGNDAEAQGSSQPLRIHLQPPPHPHLHLRVLPHRHEHANADGSPGAGGSAQGVDGAGSSRSEEGGPSPGLEEPGPAAAGHSSPVVSGTRCRFVFLRGVQWAAQDGNMLSLSASLANFWPTPLSSPGLEPSDPMAHEATTPTTATAKSSTKSGTRSSNSTGTAAPASRPWTPSSAASLPSSSSPPAAQSGPTSPGGASSPPAIATSSASSPGIFSFSLPFSFPSFTSGASSSPSANASLTLPGIANPASSSSPSPSPPAATNAASAPPGDHLVAHGGVAALARELLPVILPHVRNAAAAGVEHVVFAGHSLGGSLAKVLWAMCLLGGHCPSHASSCHSFGSPPVLAHAAGGGGGRVLRLLNAPPSSVINWVLEHDPVPRAMLTADPYFAAARAAVPGLSALLALRGAVLGEGTALSSGRFLYETVGELMLLRWSSRGGCEVVPVSEADADTLLHIAVDTAMTTPIRTLQHWLDHSHSSYHHDLETVALTTCRRQARSRSQGQAGRR